jgi:hypothetical protein
MVMGDDVGMETEDIIETLRKKFERVSGVLDERGRRVWAAAEADALGYGGQSLIGASLRVNLLNNNRYLLITGCPCSIELSAGSWS